MESTGINISFDDIFGSNPEDVSMSKLENFLERIVSDTFQQNNKNPNQLVRIVDCGVIRWMTSEEAESFLQSADQDRDRQLQQSVQQALRGDSRILEQEIKILFLLANNTLKQYHTNRLIPEAEIQRMEPTVIRLGRQVSFHLTQLQEIDRRIHDLRVQHPILDEFEEKMGTLLNLQKNGNHQAAAAIAVQLAGMKNTYVRLSRGLKSDIDAGIHLRLDLQRQKKSILSAHRYLIAQREGVLQIETKDLRESVENLKVLLRRSEGEKKTNYEHSLANKSDQLESKEIELSVVQKEQIVIKKKEEETDRIISRMEISVSPKVEEPAPAKPPEKPKVIEEPPQVEEEKKNIQRMAAVERRQHK